MLLWVGEQDGRSITSLQKIPATQVDLSLNTFLLYSWYLGVYVIQTGNTAEKKKEDYWQEHWALFSFYQEA